MPPPLYCAAEMEWLFGTAIFLRFNHSEVVIHHKRPIQCLPVESHIYRIFYRTVSFQSKLVVCGQREPYVYHTCMSDTYTWGEVGPVLLPAVVRMPATAMLLPPRRLPPADYNSTEGSPRETGPSMSVQHAPGTGGHDGAGPFRESLSR